MIISDNTVQAEGLGEICENVGRAFVKVDKKLTANVRINPGKTFGIGAKLVVQLYLSFLRQLYQQFQMWIIFIIPW